MGDESQPRTLGDYSRPSHEGNTIELPEGDNVLPLRSDTIHLVLYGCPFSRLRERMRLLFPPGKTTKLRNDILMFQQHHGESLSESWTRFKDLLQKVPHHGIDLWLKVQIFYDHVNQATRRVIDHSASGKLREKSVEESWELIEDLALYDNEKDQVQRLMEAHHAPKPSIRVNKIASSCEICCGPHVTQYCMENPEQAFVDYASSRNNGLGVEKEPEVSKIMKEERESSDIRNDDKNSDLENDACKHETELGGEEE
ncbi:MAK10-like protein [Tanacetum coccineum]